MNVILFFTFDISLKTWHETGLLERELKFFKRLISNGVKLTLVTYGDSSDLNFVNNSNIKILPIYSLIKKPKNKIFRYLKSFFIPYIIRNEIKKSDLIKTNQLMGSWVAIISKLFFRKKLIIRTGYDLLTFNVKNKKTKLIIIFTYLLTIISIIFSNRYIVSSITDKKFLNKITLKIFNKKIIIIRNWVEYTDEISYQNRTDTILTVGRLEKQKNISLLIKVANDNNVSLDIVGSGTLKRELMNLSKDLTNINFLGSFNNSQLLELYKNYKIFVVTSFFEGNPKSLLEAMSAGCIVVASNIPNISEIITDGVNGYLHNFNVEEINNIVEDIKKNYKNYENVIRNSRDTIRENFNLEDISNLEFEIYKNLTDN